MQSDDTAENAIDVQWKGHRHIPFPQTVNSVKWWLLNIYVNHSPCHHSVAAKDHGLCACTFKLGNGKNLRWTSFSWLGMTRVWKGVFATPSISTSCSSTLAADVIAILNVPLVLLWNAHARSATLNVLLLWQQQGNWLHGHVSWWWWECNIW